MAGDLKTARLWLESRCPIALGS